MLKVSPIIQGVIAAYLVFMIGNGIFSYFSQRNKDAEGFMLGGKSLSPWVLSMSEKASESSGYMTMGLPGEASVMGFSVAWAAVVSYFSLFNWFYMAKPLRRMSEIFNSLTITDYLEKRFDDKTQTIRKIGVSVMAIFEIVYVMVQFVAMGKLLSLLFGISFGTGVVIGAVVATSYTVIGGFTSVARNDFVQGIILFFGLGIMPLLMVSRLGGLREISSKMIAMHGEAWLLPYFGDMSLHSVSTFVLILGYVAIGIGFVGSPHIIVRYMAAKSKRDITVMAIIGSVWMAVSYYGAISIGMMGSIMDISLADPENIMMIVAMEMFPAVLAGLLISASLAAILSSADSMLLIAASTVAEDYFNKIRAKGKMDDAKVVNVTRITIVVMGAAGALLALNPFDSIFWLAVFAWAGLACCFGPVIILSLYWKNVTRQGAIAGMITGPAFAVLWYLLLKDSTGIYEGGPGFIVAVLVIWIVSLLTKDTGIPQIDDEWETYITNMPLESDIGAYEDGLAKIDLSRKTQNDILELFVGRELVTPSICSVVRN
jgi:sodium/proline symporter